MIRLALGLWAALAVMHLVGWRAEVAFLSGTAPMTATGLVFGLAYAVTWFAAVLVAPVLLGAGLVLRALAAMAPAQGARSASASRAMWSSTRV